MRTHQPQKSPGNIAQAISILTNKHNNPKKTSKSAKKGQNAIMKTELRIKAKWRIFNRINVTTESQIRGQASRSSHPTSGKPNSISRYPPA